MKIERINHNQMKVVFMANDLAERDINITDIITRSPEKTQGLFHEITAVLQNDYNFAAVGTPLMFEATMSHNILSIIVTKMAVHKPPGEEDFDELNDPAMDMGFAPPPLDTGAYQHTGMNASLNPGFNPALYPHPPHNGNVPPRNMKPPQIKPRSKPEGGYAMFAFETFDILASAGARIHEDYQGNSHVYKKEGKYYLLLQNVGTGSLSIRKFESLLCEYGQRQATSPLSYNQMLERGEVIIAEHGIRKLKLYCGV